MSTYAEVGIHLDDSRQTTKRLEGLVARARGAGVLADVGAFGGMFRLGAAGAFRDPVLVASVDGIGTKVKIAAVLGRYDGLGADIVNHCLNDIAVQGARPLFFLDYLALHRADPQIVTTLVASVAAACVEAGCSLLGGETAEMPDVYPPGEFDVAGFIIGVLDRSEIGANGVPSPGDVLLGLRSHGLHTNGYSLARRALPFDTWDAFDPELGMTIGDALLVPHRSYLPEIQALIGAGACAFAHITGGAQPENIARVIPEHLAAEIDTRAWETPVIFQRIASGASVSPDEMYRVFNMGIGLVAIVPGDRVDGAIEAVPEVIVIGQIVPRGDGEAVRLLGLDG
ncbi:MAG: phosphoribosylformylglycinamidine cyclo-ligase [Chloroflexota bacterium]|nr:phosphoribosylformylglycinamidine cyclo-ligase [Chloroflexia bacterium]MDQ3227102.1 phosphoribosylformylglycinamidine cyclo-ligase [Chloroflexota bacterium]